MPKRQFFTVTVQLEITDKGLLIEEYGNPEEPIDDDAIMAAIETAFDDVMIPGTDFAAPAIQPTP